MAGSCPDARLRQDVTRRSHSPGSAVPPELLDQLTSSSVNASVRITKRDGGWDRRINNLISSPCNLGASGCSRPRTHGCFAFRVSAQSHCLSSWRPEVFPLHHLKNFGGSCEPWAPLTPHIRYIRKYQSKVVHSPRYCTFKVNPFESSIIARPAVCYG